MKYTFRVSVLACLLVTALTAFADNQPPKNTLADPKDVLKIFNNPSDQFSPLKDILFINYLFNLDNYPQSQSFKAQHVFRTAIQFYQKKYQSTTDFGKQERILTEMQKLLLAGLEHSSISKTTLYAEFDEYILQLHQIRDAMNRGDIPMPGAEEFTPTAPVVSMEEKLERKTIHAIDKLDVSSSKEPFEILFQDTTIEITTESLPLQKSIGNVFYLASKDEQKKAYKVRVTEPSMESGEVLAIVTQTLLSDARVAGLIFEDRMHIPTKMDANSYELFSYGHRTMIKRSPLLCSRLFM